MIICDYFPPLLVYVTGQPLSSPTNQTAVILILRPSNNLKKRHKLVMVEELAIPAVLCRTKSVYNEKPARIKIRLFVPQVKASEGHG